MKLTNTLLIVIFVSILGGCSSLSTRSGTSTNTINDVVNASVNDISDRWQTAQTTVGEVQVGWINALGDPVLSGLVVEAKRNNRNLQAAAANIERSWALARQAGVALTPAIGLSSGATGQAFLDSPAPDTAQFSWGIQASWEADIWGRIKSGQRAAIANAQSAEADYLFSQYSIAAAVANAYFLGLEASLQADVARKTLATLSETDRIVKVQFEEGMAMLQDVALSASDLASTRASLITAEGSYRNAIKALQVLIGRYPGGDLKIQSTLPTVPPMPPAGLPSELLERRPDIIAAERTVAASFYAIDQVKVANFPTLNLTGGPGGASNQLIDMLNSSNILFNLTATIAKPLFDGGFNQFQIDQAEAEQKQAIAAYSQTVLTAFQEVETSLDQATVLRDRTDALRESAEQANRALDIAQIRYTEGETDLIDMLTIQQRVFNAESNLVTAERSRLDEWINLNLALGGSWE